MDAENLKTNVKVVLPIVRRVVTIPNWRQFVTIENLNNFLMNSQIMKMCSAADSLEKDNIFGIDLPAEFMAMLATCFIAEYNIFPTKRSPSYWNDYMQGRFTI